MGLFTKAELSRINEAAKKSNQGLQVAETHKRTKKGAKAEIDAMSAKVEEYFKDSEAILVSTKEELHSYIDKCIEAGYCAIDTETTGLDRVKDTIVGFSLYYPGGHECYVPNKHLIFIFDEPCKGQLSYEDSGMELQRLVDAKTKMIFANADYDIAMIWKDFHVDMCDVCYYDVILAWRCLKENELKNGLKELYSKYVLRGKGDPMKFSDFFSVDLFPYCKPQIAKLYAANDAKITYELFRWQLPYTIKSNEKCKRNNLEGIADIIWNLEFPMIKVCAMMHRNGMYFDDRVAQVVAKRYHNKYNEELADLHSMVQDLIDDMDTLNNRKRPFATGNDFNPTSPKHVQYLCYSLLKLPNVEGSTGKEVLRDFGLPQTDKVLAVRSLSVLINSFVDKLRVVAAEYDGRIHGQFKSVGAGTGRMSSSNPNCISKGTNISCVGELKPIENVTPGDLVYCVDEATGNVKIQPVLNVWNKGSKPCVKVTWKSLGNHKTGSVILTADHKLLTQDAGYVCASKLQIGQKIKHLKREVVKNRNVVLYSQPGSLSGSGLMFEHQFIKLEYFHVDTKLDIHHKDHNHMNNHIDNLVPCTRAEHANLHKQRVDVIDSSSLPVNFVQHKYKLVTKDEWLQVLEVYGYCFTAIPMDYGTFQKYMHINDIDYMQLKANASTRFTLNKYTDDEIVKTFEANNCSLYDTWCYFDCDWYSLKSRLLNCGIDVYNHVVVSVEPCGSYDVFDMEVDKYHNFFANELCCKNCQNIPSHATDIRHMFRATPQVDENVEVQGNSITLKYYDRVETADGFVPCGKLKASDTLYLTDDSNQTHIVAVQNVDIDNDNVTVTWQ